MAQYKRLLIASSKGGVGKSTTALGLAAAFAKNGEAVTLVDLDFASRSLDMLTGSENDCLFNFGDIMNGSEISAAVHAPIKNLENLHFISAGTFDGLKNTANERGESESEIIRAALDRIICGVEYDILICDTGGGVEYAKAVADMFDLVIITSEQGKTSVRAAEYTASQLEEHGAREMRLVICSFDLNAVRKEKRAGVIEMIDQSALVCAGVVPFDKTLQRAQDRGELTGDTSCTSIAYRNIARRIAGYDVKLFEGMKWYERRKFFAF